MPVPQTAKSQPRRRLIGFRAAMVLLMAVAGLAFLAKGSGFKSWVVRHFRNPHVPTRVELTAQVRLNRDPEVGFERVGLPPTFGSIFTCIRIGPDGKLYGATIEGQIRRFPINADGTVGAPEEFDSLQKANNGSRLLTGFCFDPDSTAEHPTIWAANGFLGFENVPDWTGKITRLSGPGFSVVHDVVVGLPRSIHDHLTNQPKFGPDGALYFPQGCNSAFGAPDAQWGMRPERMLSGTILRLEVSRLTSDQTIDARTTDGGGTYDPFAPGAPLTIYACGIRNAWSLVWTTDGRLYVPTNGASAGGNTPAGGGAPAVSRIPDEDDWLFHVVRGGYYGHPNPQLGHFVLNGGNPGGIEGPAVIAQYPVGTKPDPMWTPAVYDFGPHVSANGVVEYLGPAFGGRLEHKLIVCRYNAGSDLCSVIPDNRGEFTSALSIIGTEDLNQPLDVTEDLRTGNLYVTEYGGKRITLLRPMTPDQIKQALVAASNLRRPLSPHAENGRQLYNMSCIACHGVTGQGILNLGANLQNSKFLAQTPDAALVEFIRVGRLPDDPKSILKLAMPPMGGNPSLDDAGLRDIVAFLRTLQADANGAAAKSSAP